jgi:hypothetical protein
VSAPPHRWRKASGSPVELGEFDIAEDAVDDVLRLEADQFIPENLSDRGTPLCQLERIQDYRAPKYTDQGIDI